MLLKNSLNALLLIFIFTAFSHAETSWITKKNDKTKEVGKASNSWIKKKEVKKNKKEYKTKEKEISKEIKSWIKKKTKPSDQKYERFEDLKNKNFYFVALNEDTGELFYGFTNSKKKVFFENSNFLKNSEGYGFLDDGNTVCKVGTEILAVVGSKIFGEVGVNCGKIKFNGDFSQTLSKGSGILRSKDGQKLRFDFYKDKKLALKNFDKNKNFFAKLNSLQIPTDSSESNKLTLNPNGKYIALLIGNSSYAKWASLKSPKNDVEEIDKVLKNKYNFKTIKIIDGNEKEIMKGFKKLSNITTDNDYVLIYYSGHGDSRGVNNYWIPIDGEKEFGLGDWINTAEIANYIKEEIPNRHIVLMSDSCYFNISTKGNKISNNKSKAYEKLLKRRAIMVIQSGSNEPVLDDDDEKHSMFAKSFLNSIKDNDNVITMSRIIEDIYNSHAGMRQQPLGIRLKGWGDASGDFLFIANK